MIIVLLLSLCFGSCGLKDFTDYEDLVVKSSTEMILPLAYGGLSMQVIINMMSEDSLFGKNDKNELVISFIQDDIFSFSVNELITFENSIDLISNEELIDLNTTISDIINDFEFMYGIELGELIEEMSGDIEELKGSDGQEKQFPKYTHEPEMPTEFSPDPIDDFELITFESGQMVISLTNNFPVYGIDVEAELWDQKLNRSIGTISYGFDKEYPGYEIYYTDDWFGGPIGLPGSICIDGGAAGAATESDTILLNNTTMSNELLVRLKYFGTKYGSGNRTPLINFADALDFEIDFRGTIVSSGKFSIPEKTISAENEKLENVKISDDIDLHKAILKEGTLNIIMKKTLPITGNMNLTFPAIKRNGTIISTQGAFSSEDENLFTVDLAGTEINFAENNTNIYNTLFYSYEVQINQTNVDYIETDAIVFDIAISNLSIESAEGNFGQMEIVLDENDFNLSLDILDGLQGDFVFLNPSIQLVINNSALKAPTKVALDLTGFNKNGSSAKLDPQPFEIPIPDLPVEKMITGKIEINKDNSNIVEFISLPPTQNISYSGNIQLNPEGDPVRDNLNYIFLDGEIGFDLVVDIPIQFQTEGISFSDTLAFDGSALDLINSGELTLRAENGLPFGVELQLSFIDSINSQSFGEDVEVMLLEAASVDETGKAISPSTSESSIELKKTNIPHYRQANAIIFVATIVTPNQGDQPAKLSSTDEIYLNVGLKAGINYSKD